MEEVNTVPRKKQQAFNQADWIAVSEAAAIISEHSNHTVSPDYVRGLGNQGKIETWTINRRIKLYRKSDVEQRRVEQYKKGKTGD